MMARVALVGCGRWGRNILRDLLELGAEVVIADLDPAACAHAGAAGARERVGDLDALPEVDGIVVATPTRTHAAVLEALLPRGVPIFCEKPLTADRASAVRLAELGNGRLFVMDKWRYHPGVEELRDLARSGALGAVRGVRTMRNGWASPHDVDAVWILAPHDLSIALEILGELPAPRSAYAEQLDGVAVGLVGVLGDAPWVVIDVSAATPTVHREVRLSAADGIAVLAGAYSDHVHITRRGLPAERRKISTEPPLRRELHAFLAHLAGGAPPKSSAADGAALVGALARLRALAGLEAEDARQ
jgi:predicted dehydrogenase